MSGLVPLVAGDDYELVGIRTAHRSSHHGRPEFIAILKSVAKQLNSAGNLNLQVNDISLPAGGVFDLNLNWKPSHFTHRFGKNADIRRVPVDKRRLLYDIFRQQGVTVLDEGDHWSCINRLAVCMEFYFSRSGVKCGKNICCW